MKKKIKKIMGQERVGQLVSYYLLFKKFQHLIINFHIDFYNYYKHSHVFSTNSFNKIESELILDYHGIEKGFLHDDIRFKFAETRVKRMIVNMEELRYDASLSSQVAISLKVLSDYYDLHEKNGVSIENYFPRTKYEKIKNNLSNSEKIYSEVTGDEYFGNVESAFPIFADSRKSIRNYSSKLVEEDVMKSVINIARNSPSVCNRQPSKVHFVQNKELIKKILTIQGGLTGFEDEINQILVVTANRNYFFSVGERNQLFIDGGIFLMNLLYSLHYHKIAACPANWGKEYKDDVKAREILKISPSEKIICLLAIGYIEGPVRYTLSKRRTAEELLSVIY